MALAIVEVDPQGADALALLDEAAREARELYQEVPAHSALRPVNGPTPAFASRSACWQEAHAEPADRYRRTRRSE